MEMLSSAFQVKRTLIFLASNPILGQHIILIVSSVLGIILLLIVSFTIDAFFFDFSFKSKDSLAHAPVSDFVLGFIYKAVAVILTAGIFDLAYNSLIALYHVVFNFFFLFNSIKKVTYFDINIHVTYLITSATLVWANGIFILVDLINFQLIRDNTIILILVGSYFFVQFCKNIRRKTQDNLLTKEASELDSDILLDAKVRFFFKLAKSAQNDSQSDLLLSSLIKIHIDRCVDSKCPCRMRKSLFDPKRNQMGDMTQNAHKDQTFIKHFIYYILKSGYIKFFNSELLFLDSTFFLFEAMRNYPQAYHLIHLYRKKNLSTNPRIVMQFLIYRLYARMQEYMEDRNTKEVTNVLAYERVMEYDKEFNVLKTMIISQIEFYMNVWEMIDSEFPDLNILNKLLEKTFNYKEKVIEQYNKTVKINNQSFELQVLMETYARYVAYDEELAVRVSHEIQTKAPMDNHSENFILERDMDIWNIFDQNCYTIEIADNMDRLGHIINFSKNAKSILGFEDEELRHQNVKILIPRVIAVQHDRILREFFQHGIDGGLRKPMHNFSINRKGYCFSCHMVIKAFPMHDKYRIIASFRKLNDSDYLITDEKGVIDSFSEKLSKMLELTPQTAQQGKLNLVLIAPKIVKYIHSYWIKKSKKLGDTSLEQPKSFYLFIPPDWRSFLQRWQEKAKLMGGSSLPSLNSGICEEEDPADIDKYYHVMLEYMQNDIKKSYKKIVKVKAIIEHMELRNGEIRMKSFKIISFKEINKKDIEFISEEKIRKQESFLPLLAKKIEKVLEQKKIDEANQERHRVEQKEAEAAEFINEATTKEGGEPRDVVERRPKGNWDNIFVKTKSKALSKRPEKSLEALIHAESHESDYSDRDPVDAKEDTLSIIQEGQISFQRESIAGTGSQSNTEKTLFKKQSILKRKASKDYEQTLEKKISALDKLKKKVMIIQEKKRKQVEEDMPAPVIHRKEKKKSSKAKKAEKDAMYISLLTEGTSSDEDYDGSDKNNSKEDHESKVTIDNYAKKKQQQDIGLAKEGMLEAKAILEKKQIGPSSVSSSTNHHNKDFTVKVKRLLREKYVPASLKMSNTCEIFLTLTVLILINILSAISRDKVGAWVGSIQTVNTPNFYEVFLFKAADSYLMLDLLSEGIVSNTIYDDSWVQKDRTEREWIYNSVRNLMFRQVSNPQSIPDLLPLYFDKYDYNVIMNNIPQTIRTDFVGYLGLFMNSLNETLYYSVPTYAKTKEDEYLYILNNNFFLNMDFIQEHKNLLYKRDAQLLKYGKLMITAEQISAICIIVCSFLITLPMFIQHNLHLEEVLILFTNISKRDSDFYYTHYKNIRMTWTTNSEDLDRLQERGDRREQG